MTHRCTPRGTCSKILLVGQLVGQSIRGLVLHPLVGCSVTLLNFLPKSYRSRITAALHPYATSTFVYTALF